MNTELFHDAMGMIDDDLIEAVGKLRTRKRHRRELMRWASLAACLCVVAGGVWIWSRADQPTAETSDGFHGLTNTESFREGVTIPRMTVDIGAGAEGDMRGFFIYNGRSYVQNEFFSSDVSFVDEYLARVDQTIDEWSSIDDYIELTGSITGDVYTVSGYDPSFMLCMKLDNGAICTYINDNGITLSKGAELFEDRLQLSQNFTAIEFQTREDWYYSRGNIKELEESDLALPESVIEGAPSESSHESVVDRFLAALNEGDFIYTDEVELREDEASIYDRELYHLFFRMENGMTTHLRLYEGGYVRFDGFIPVCVRMDEGAFNELIDLLNSK